MLVARTSDEAHLYMELHLCECGETRFEPRHWLEDRDGVLVAVYEGECPSCGRPRRFEFAMDPAMPPASPSFGHGVSQIIDPGEFHYASDISVDKVRLLDHPKEQWPQARRDVRRAIAALEEVLKFIPPGQDAVPASAFSSKRGRVYYSALPDHFTRQAIEERVRTYRDLLASVGG